MTPKNAWEMRKADENSQKYLNLVENNFKNKLKNHINLNKQRKDYQHKIGELVFKKNYSQDKVEDKYLGPFQITKIKNDKIFLNEGNKTTVNNVKNIKPGEGGR